ncbi:helix-turn-helix domain-containing protein [Paenarthrobacter nitroguajacolicus]|uniref:helix-turn-helix domain-containing protein n=1 Tax=Paenarthrobacter nitroguajacolicus TaxID=211146 RepID=UPI003AE5247A
MSVYRPPKFSALGAHVSGPSAWVLVKILERVKAVDSIQRAPEDVRDEALETYDALRAAAIYWQDQRMGSSRTLASPVLAEPPADIAIRSMSAAEAALLLGCTERRVRQLLAAERIAGQRVAGRWLVDADSVDDYLIAKAVA